MKHSTALVSGGTSGVGLSIVRELVSRGLVVHFIGTNEAKGKRIEAELNSSGGDSHFVALDLSSLRAVKAFSEEFSAKVPALDILANVAGVLLPDRTETAEGIEKTFAIGYLSAYLLCRELAPLLSRGDHARIANVAGDPSQVLKPNLDFEQLDFAENYGGIRVAISTVHAKTVMTQVLADRFRDQGIDVNAFHPGLVKSDLGRHMSFPLSLLFKAGSAFMSSSSTSGIHVTTSDDVTGVTGQLFVKKKARPLTFDPSYQDRLVSVTETMIERALGA